MRKETHDIPITLVLPRYEVMFILHTLQKLANLDREGGFQESSKATQAIADRIFATTREQFVTFESQNENP